MADELFGNGRFKPAPTKSSVDDDSGQDYRTQSFRKTIQVGEADLLAEVDRIPTLPAVVQEILARAGSQQSSASEMEDLIRQDMVIAGHDRDDIGLLIFPSLTGCRELCSELAEDSPLSIFLADARVRACVGAGLQRLQSEGIGSSTYATRAAFLTEPPQIDAGEITDKGYLNQRAVLERRTNIIAQLYAQPSAADVIYLY